MDHSQSLQPRYILVYKPLDWHCLDFGKCFHCLPPDVMLQLGAAARLELWVPFVACTHQSSLASIGAVFCGLPTSAASVERMWSEALLRCLSKGSAFQVRPDQSHHKFLLFGHQPEFVSRMSLLAMPFLIINFGGEMIYILEQRLHAQNIPKDKSNKGSVFLSCFKRSCSPPAKLFYLGGWKEGEKIYLKGRIKKEGGETKRKSSLKKYLGRKERHAQHRRSRSHRATCLFRKVEKQPGFLA